MGELKAGHKNKFIKKIERPGGNLKTQTVEEWVDGEPQAVDVISVNELSKIGGVDPRTAEKYMKDCFGDGSRLWKAVPVYRVRKSENGVKYR